jgi:hypothetical protein
MKVNINEIVCEGGNWLKPVSEQGQVASFSNLSSSCIKCGEFLD